MLFAVQTTIAQGDSLGEKFEQLVRWGYDGVEVSGADLLERADEVRRASDDTGLRVTSACGGYQGWLVERNPRARALAIAQIQRILAVGAEMGIPGLVVPAAYGIGARAGLPPARYAFTVDEERALLLDSLEQVLASAERSGGVLYLEPLNRYEDRVLNTLAEARAIIDQVRLDHEKIAGLAHGHCHLQTFLATLDFENIFHTQRFGHPLAEQAGDVSLLPTAEIGVFVDDDAIEAVAEQFALAPDVRRLELG